MRSKFPVVSQWTRQVHSIHEDAGSIPGLAQWLRIRCCCELWCRSQMRLRSRIAMAVAMTILAAAVLSQSPAWERPYAPGMALKKKKKKDCAATGTQTLQNGRDTWLRVWQFQLPK